LKMDRVAQLEHEVALVRGFLRQEEDKLALQPASQSAKFFFDAKLAQLRELEKELQLAKAARLNELLEIRLSGLHVARGSIPLELLARLAAPLNDVITSAAYRLATGDEPTGRVPEDLKELLNLRLAGIAPGSTRLLILGNVTPDATGDSILENALRQLFLFGKSPSDLLLDAIDALGIRASRKIADFLHEIDRAELGFSFVWEAPGNEEFRWEGDATYAAQLRERIAQVREGKVYENILKGEVRNLADTGRIEIRTSESPRVKIRYPKDKYGLVTALHLGEEVQLRVRTHEYVDNVRRESTIAHHLLDLVDSSGETPSSARSEERLADS
jgi:hypothetical protein